MGWSSVLLARPILLFARSSGEIMNTAPFSLKNAVTGGLTLYVVRGELLAPVQGGTRRGQLGAASMRRPCGVLTPHPRELHHNFLESQNLRGSEYTPDNFFVTKSDLESQTVCLLGDADQGRLGGSMG